LPPPSPRSTTSWASSSSSASRSPLLGGREEAGRELLLLLARGLEPGAPLLDVPAGPRDELAGVLLARGDDLRDPIVGLVEHVVQQERGALLGRQALEQDEEG